jgi:hypothetical protein
MPRISPLLILCAVLFLSHAGFVPPAELCLPSSHLKELSGCIAMTNKEDECAAKETEDENLDCYCTQEYLSSIFAYVYVLHLPPLCRAEAPLGTLSVLKKYTTC